MISGILGKKIGMTQIFKKDGRRVTVTVLEAGPCVVQVVKTIEKDGYSAVQVGYCDTKEKLINKPQREYLKANQLTPKRFVREFRCDKTTELKMGDKITTAMFQRGDYLDVTGVSKGKGFQGGMKRHNWMGGCETHGSMSHRAPGSIGASSFPSKVTKGHPMAGHMGTDKVTVQNLVVVDVDNDNNTIAVEGAVPGSNGGYVVIKYAKKKKLAPRGEVKEEEEEAVEEEKDDKQRAAKPKKAPEKPKAKKK